VDGHPAREIRFPSVLLEVFRSLEFSIRDMTRRFDEAKTVFYDESAIRYFDPDRSDDEDRF
jgi:hypothetical protein